MKGQLSPRLAAVVGALDGRHPALETRAHQRIARALCPRGRFFIDGGDPLQEITIGRRLKPGNPSHR